MGWSYISGVVHPPLAPPSREGDWQLGRGTSVLVSGDFDFLYDRFQHAVGIIEDVVVPEADDAVAMGFDDSRACGVVGAVGMLPAVAFDGKPEAATGEVGDVVSDRELPCEFHANRSCAQVRPEPPLRIRHLASQLARNVSQSLFSHHGTPIPNPFPQGKGLSVAKSS